MSNAAKNCLRFILSLKCKYPTKNNINVSKPAITTRILPNDFFVEIVYIQNKLPMKKFNRSVPLNIINWGIANTSKPK